MRELGVPFQPELAIGAIARPVLVCSTKLAVVVGPLEDCILTDGEAEVVVELFHLEQASALDAFRAHGWPCGSAPHLAGAAVPGRTPGRVGAMEAVPGAAAPT